MDLSEMGSNTKKCKKTVKKIEKGSRMQTTKGKEDIIFTSEKVFQNRDSLLTEMLEIPHVNAILNMFFAFMFIMIFNIILSDWLNKGIFNHVHHLWWVVNEFAKPLWVISTLIVLYIVCLLVFVTIRSWVQMRFRIKKHRLLIDFGFFLIYLFLFFAVIYVPIYVALYIVLPPCSASVIAYEQVRLIMKLHAYIRSIVPQVMKEMSEPEENKKDKKELTEKSLEEIVSCKHYLYFMIIPTLIYRNSYPKRQIVNYKFALSNTIQFILCVTFLYNIFIVLMRDNFVDFNSSFWKVEIFYKKFFHSVLPTILMMFTLFFCFLHSWLNLFAEMTKFGDRLFYSDWWSATSLSDYYRTWNVLIHDWLYNYIYKDIVLSLYFLTKNKKMSKGFASISVFFVSAVVHEYILAYCFRFFYPVLLLVFFIFGSSLYFVKAKRTSRISNILLWISLFIGNTLFFTLYSFEWFARKNCKRTINGYMDYFIPRSLFCKEM